MARAERQSLKTRDRMSHNGRSAGVSFGRCFTERFKTLTWWRRARFSSSTAARERKADRKRVIKIGRTRIETELRGGGNLHHLREIGISDRHMGMIFGCRKRATPRAFAGVFSGNRSLLPEGNAT